MTRHPIEQQIHRADNAIMAEDFDTLIDIYTQDAVLVVKPGMNAVGKASIRKAFEAIAAYFNHSISVQQAGMVILETGDTALVLAKTLVSASNLPVIERKATYVFTRTGSGEWLCSIDNSYGHDLLNPPDA
jgi:ketosteroid isomerase-like protein